MVCAVPKEERSASGTIAIGTKNEWTFSEGPLSVPPSGGHKAKPRSTNAVVYLEKRDMIVVSGFLVLFGIYLSCYVIYWYILLGTHFFLSKQKAKIGSMETKFAIVIPAHNEELLLPRLLASASGQDYPGELFDTIVVADNCSDGTANLARLSGAKVLERSDDKQKGKGYAIKWALEKIGLDNYDAVVIIDADCIMDCKFLGCLEVTLQGMRVVQCYSGVANPDESWFTRLLDVSRTINNDVYHPAKVRLGFSSQLMGTGMCFLTSVLKQYGWEAFTVGEDCEYYAILLQNGETVGFSQAAKVFHEESSSLKQATSQRMRWSSGRFAVAWKYGFRLLLRGVIERNFVKFEAGMSLILPNPSLGMNITGVCLVGAFLIPIDHKTTFMIWFFLLVLAQFGVFLTGVFHTKNRISKLMAIFVAPVFLAWKMGIDALSILGVGRSKWVKTERKSPPSSHIV